MATTKVVPANFREFVYNLSPGSWRRYWGERFLGATLGLMGDMVAEGARLAVASSKLTHPDFPVDALDLIGVERLLPRFPGEAYGTYKARLLSAWNLWRQAGTAGGIAAMFAAIGLTAEIKLPKDWNWGGEGYAFSPFTNVDYYAESTKTVAAADGASFYVSLLLSLSGTLTQNSQAIISTSVSNSAGFVAYVSASGALTFHYKDDVAASVVAGTSLTPYIGKPLLLQLWYSASDNKAHIGINGVEVAESATTGTFEAGSSPMRVGARADNATYYLKDASLSIAGVSAGNILPTPALLQSQWESVVASGVIRPMAEGDHAWDFSGFSYAPSIIADENADNPDDLALVGAGPGVKEVGTGLYWSRLWVVLTGHGWVDDGIWDDPGTWDDGGTWDTDATPDEVRATRNIVRLFKSAHEVCPAICVVLDELPWAANQPDGTWGNPLNRSLSAAYWST